ncbi:hypothetical protein BU17DRAFT_44275 [Hysterangium stoloniferum]|nr:hypothetical protein BU17DRAFT_44275 [Hysterangium stoloniferum]
MMSLYSAEPLPDFEGTLQLICSGGKKAADWLKDKEAASGFISAGIYQPLSKIPLEIWKASPSTSNGNEQAHRNINRDGIKLTMLVGIMCMECNLALDVWSASRFCANMVSI